MQLKGKFGEDGSSFPAAVHPFGFPGTVSVLVQVLVQALVQVLVFTVQQEYKCSDYTATRSVSVFYRVLHAAR